MSDDEGTGAGNAIDVFGSFIAIANKSSGRKYSEERQLLWNRERDESISMREYHGNGGVRDLTLEQSVVFKFDDPNLSSSSIVIRAFLKDADDPATFNNQDDNLGGMVQIKVPLKEIGELLVTKNMHFNSDHGRVQALLKFQAIR